MADSALQDVSVPSDIDAGANKFATAAQLSAVEV